MRIGKTLLCGEEGFLKLRFQVDVSYMHNLCVIETVYSWTMMYSACPKVMVCILTCHVNRVQDS